MAAANPTCASNSSGADHGANPSHSHSRRYGRSSKTSRSTSGASSRKIGRRRAERVGGEGEAGLNLECRRDGADIVRGLGVVCTGPRLARQQPCDVCIAKGHQRGGGRYNAAAVRAFRHLGPPLVLAELAHCRVLVRLDHALQADVVRLLQRNVNCLQAQDKEIARLAAALVLRKVCAEAVNPEPQLHRLAAHPVEADGRLCLQNLDVLHVAAAVGIYFDDALVGVAGAPGADVMMQAALADLQRQRGLADCRLGRRDGDVIPLTFVEISYSVASRCANRRRRDVELGEDQQVVMGRFVGEREVAVKVAKAQVIGRAFVAQTAGAAVAQLWEAVIAQAETLQNVLCVRGRRRCKGLGSSARVRQARRVRLAGVGTRRRNLAVHVRHVGELSQRLITAFAEQELLQMAVVANPSANHVTTSPSSTHSFSSKQSSGILKPAGYCLCCAAGTHKGKQASKQGSVLSGV
eukprot:m.135827 g.135827  ORF g.135827 m.135827 type:complete len:465 (-) comp16570_c0_seq2:38-1432(-)